MIGVKIDYLVDTLQSLLAIPSPTGYTDRIVHRVCEELDHLEIPYEITRRGAIRANLKGQSQSPDRAVVAHLDTLGAMVKQLKPNGRLAIVPIGHWSPRFAEGGRVTIFTDVDSRRGTVLPLKASGHTYGDEVDKQPVSWDNLEVRVDVEVKNEQDLERFGFAVGDFIAFDTNTEVCQSGFINSRHLDDKAGVACMLAAAKGVKEAGAVLPIDCHLLFTISEEVGSGASAALHQDVAELVAVDNATNSPDQHSSEDGVTIAMADSCGPFDYHLTHHLLRLASRFSVPHQRDVFKYYRCDAASAIEAGNDIRTALVAFAVDASHGYERTHVSSLFSLAKLLAVYMTSPITVPHDAFRLGPLKGFPSQPMEEAEPHPGEGAR